jgi:hypothetical protein
MLLLINENEYAIIPPLESRRQGGTMRVSKAGLQGILLLSLLALVTCAPNLVPKGWELLLKREVSFANSRETIELPTAAKPLRSLLIVARMNDIEISGIRITFENGDDFSPDLRLRMKANVDSQVIDLPGGARRVRRIEFRYRELIGKTRRAAIELWGK